MIPIYPDWEVGPVCLHRVRNRILQYLYRPRQTAPRILSPQMLATMDAVDKAIEEKITPLLSGLWHE